MDELDQGQGDKGDGPGKGVRLRICRHRCVNERHLLYRRALMIERRGRGEFAAAACCPRSTHVTAFCKHRKERNYFHRPSFQTTSPSTDTSDVLVVESRTVRARVGRTTLTPFHAGRNPVEESRSSLTHPSATAAAGGRLTSYLLRPCTRVTQAALVQT